MKKFIRTIALGLSALMLTLSPVAAFGKELEAMPISAPIEEQPFEYIKMEGVVEEIEKGDDFFRILVRNDSGEGLDVLWAYINDEMLLLSDKTMSPADAASIEKGMEVTIYYHKNSVMAMSYPGQMRPDVVVLHDGGEEANSVMVELFDKELLSADGSMIIRPGEETVIVDFEGKEATAEMIKDRELVIFYNIVLESYPMQTSPLKIIILPEREKLEEPTGLILNEELQRLEDGLVLIPLRQVAEYLGYNVKWNGEARTVELTKGPHWTMVTIGTNTYSFAKMLIRLETAPVIYNDRTYVPVSFAEQVLQAKVESLPEGGIRIYE